MEVNYSMVSRVKGQETFYSGQTAIRALNIPGISYLSEECCLWYFLFLRRDILSLPGFDYAQYDGHCKKYLGFLDFDFPDVNFSALSMPEILMVFENKLYGLLEEHYAGRWFAFFSGSKGFHVYICNPEFVFQAQNFSMFTRPRMILALKSLLPSQLFDLIDDSIYAKNKGIRPFTQPNPKNPTYQPRSWFLKSKNSEWVNDKFELFNWLSEQCNRTDNQDIMKFSGLLNKRVPPALLPGPASKRTTTVHKRRDFIEVDSPLPTLDEKKMALRMFIKQKMNLGHLPEFAAHSTENLYFAPEDSWCMCSDEKTVHQRTKCWWRIFPTRAVQKCIAQRHANCELQLDFVPRVVAVPEPGNVAEPTPNVCDFFAPLLPGQKVLVPIDRQYLDPEQIKQLLMPEGSRLLVCSPMGTGKTFSLNKVIQENRDQLKRILVIGTRVAQCCVYNGAFDGSVLYKDSDKETPLHEVPFLVVCLNSLLKVLKPGMVIPQYDLVIVDECMTTLSGLVSSLLSSKRTTNQPAVFELFKAFLLSAGRVVMMDGLPTSRLYRFLSGPKLNIWSAFKILQHQKRGDTGKKFIFVDNPKDIENFVKDTLGTETGSVVLVSDSKVILKHMHRCVPPEILSATICGDAEQVIKKTATDPNKNWKDLRYLGYNTALGPGASFDPKTVEEGAFTELVVILTCMTSTPSEIYQLISRMRYLVNQRVHVCILENSGRTEMDFSLPEDDLHREMNLQLLQGIKGTDVFLQNLPLQIGIQLFDEHSVEPYLGLEVDEERLCLFRGLVAERQMRLVYEQSDFVSLLSEVRLEEAKFRDSERFAGEFSRLVSLNGGTLLRPPGYTIRDHATKLKVQRSWMQGVRKTGKTRESRLFPAGDLLRLSEENKLKITDMVKVDDDLTQLRFLCMMRYFKDLTVSEEKANKRFAYEIERFFVGRPENTALEGVLRISDLATTTSSHTVTAPELCVNLAKLIRTLGLHFCPESGLIEGTFGGEHLETFRESIVQNLLEVTNVRRKLQKDCSLYVLNAQYSNPREKINFYRSLKLMLTQTFTWAGFTLKDRNSRGAKKHEYYLCPVVSKLRYALKELNCDTFEKVTREEAIVYFSGKYLV